MAKIKIPSERGNRVACALCGKTVDEYQIIPSPDGTTVCVAVRCHNSFDLAVYPRHELRIWAGTDGPDDELHAPPTMMFLRSVGSNLAYPVVSRMAVQRYAEVMGAMWMGRYGLPDVWQRRKAPPVEQTTVKPRRRRMEEFTTSAPGALKRTTRRLDDV